MIFRHRYVDSRYALKEELEEVRDDVKIIKSDTVELKSVMNFIKWLILATVPVTAIITNVGQEIKDNIKDTGPRPDVDQQQQVIEWGGEKFLIVPKPKE